MCRPKFRPCENKVLILALRNGREQMIIIFITLYSVSACRKSLFFKNSEISLSLTPNPFPPWKAVYAWLALHRAKPLCIHTRHPCRGLSVGLPPSPSKDACSQSHTVAARCSDTNDWQPALGLRPKQGCFGCLPKVLHDAKPTEQATLNTHFQKLYRFIDRLKNSCKEILFKA